MSQSAWQRVEGLVNRKQRLARSSEASGLAASSGAGEIPRAGGRRTLRPEDLARLLDALRRRPA
jgi:hypothetical protein